MKSDCIPVGRSRIGWSQRRLASPVPPTATSTTATWQRIRQASRAIPKKPARIVQIVMREADGKMLLHPASLTVKQGEQIRFVVRNNGDGRLTRWCSARSRRISSTLKQMKKNPDMEHDDPNAQAAASPKTSGEIVWQFTKAGKFDFACLIPGHLEAGMFGKIVVE